MRNKPKNIFAIVSNLKVAIEMSKIRDMRMNCYNFKARSQKKQSGSFTRGVGGEPFHFKFHNISLYSGLRH